MFAGKTYSDARVVANNPSSTSGSEERNVLNKNHLIKSEPSFPTKKPPDVLSDDQLESSNIPLTVAVKTGTQFFSNPERIYPMCSKPRGKAIIINNQKFEDPETYPFRLGANVDSENLEQLLSQLSFEVIKYENLRRNDTMKIMIDLADTVGGKANPCDMLIVCMMSHGREHGKIVSSDCYNIDIEQDILRRFNNEYCPQLQGIPKFFLLQACRGDDRDYGTLKTVSSDDVDASRSGLSPPGAPRSARPRSLHIKDLSWEDMVIAYSTLPGYVSNRDHYKGTWFIESICKAFMEHAKDMDLRDLLDEAAFILKSYESEAGTKQSFSYEVRHFYKKLYFNPGHFVSARDLWKHKNSSDFDLILLDRSLQELEDAGASDPSGAPGAPGPPGAPVRRKRTFSEKII